MTLMWPWWLLLLPLPWLARRWLRPADAGAVLRVPSLAVFAPPNTAHAGPPIAPARRRPSIEFGLAACAWLALVLAAARPLGFPASGQLPVSGRDLMIALDISASMATTDLSLNGQAVERLYVARELARDFVARRDGDRIGLIVFGKQAFLHTPLTFDLQAVRAALADTGVGLAGRETALGDAVALAAQHLREFDHSARVLVLLTDGANTAGQLSPAQAGWIAAREGLRIHVVAIGAPTSTSAATATTDLDEKSLRQLAEQTGGSYRRAIDSAALGDFYRLVDRLEPSDQGQAAIRPARELYPWPLALALALTACILLLRLRRPTPEGRAW